MCAKAKGDVCGGLWIYSGVCASGLTCFKQCDEKDEWCAANISQEPGTCLNKTDASFPPKMVHYFEDGVLQENVEKVITCKEF